VTSRAFDPRRMVLQAWGGERGHECLGVSSPLDGDWQQLLPTATWPQVHALRVEAADRLARLGWALELELLDLRTAHGCRPIYGEDACCGLMASRGLVDPGVSADEEPTLYLFFPEGQARRWRRRVVDLLTRLASADADPNSDHRP